MDYFPSYDNFEKDYQKGQSQLVWADVIADTDTPVSALLKLMSESSYHILFESVQGGETRARYSAIALHPDILWRCVGGHAEISRDAASPTPSFTHDSPNDAQEVFASLRRLMAETKVEIPPALPPIASGLFGYMGYDMVKLMEQLPNKNEDKIGVPQALYMRPTVTIVFDSVKGQAHIITLVNAGSGADAQTAYDDAQARINAVIQKLRQPLPAAAPHAGNIGEFHSHIAREEYHAIVEKAKEYIVAGDIFQVVPSRRLSCDFPLPHISFYRALRNLNPSPYLFYVGMNGFSLVGSSPEILVRLKQGVVTIRPIAGTRKRGVDVNEDVALEKELLADGKELSEHLMLLDLGRNDVGRVAKPGTVRVTEQMIIERYSHVMHIVSNVEGDIAEEKDCIDALIAGFPAGTVSGAPKIRAMEIIDELEREQRSFYGGTVGYISANGDMDTCIALRTALIKDNTLYVQAGGGVVADSDPEAEFQETENKAMALMKAAKQAVHFN